MAEGEVEDICKRSRPTTSNEVAAMMRNRLELNKLKSEMKLIRIENDHTYNSLIRQTMDHEQFLIHVQKSTGYSFDKSEINKNKKKFPPPNYLSIIFGKHFFSFLLLTRCFIFKSIKFMKMRGFPY